MRAKNRDIWNSEALNFKMSPDQQELAMSCYGLAVMLTNNYLRCRFNHSRFCRDKVKNHFDDCLQMALIGLCAAARGYKEELGFAFTTYARYGVMTWLRRGERLNDPEHLGPGWNKVYNCDSTKQNRRGARVFMFSEIAAATSDSPTNIEDLMVNKGFDDQARLLEIIQLPDVKDLEKMLPPRWWHVIWGRANGKTLDSLGKELGITMERARQIEKQAIHRLSLLPAVRGILYG